MTHLRHNSVPTRAISRLMVDVDQGASISFIYFMRFHPTIRATSCHASCTSFMLTQTCLQVKRAQCR